MESWCTYGVLNLILFNKCGQSWELWQYEVQDEKLYYSRDLPEGPEVQRERGLTPVYYILYVFYVCRTDQHVAKIFAEQSAKLQSLISLKHYRFYTF